MEGGETGLMTGSRTNHPPVNEGSLPLMVNQSAVLKAGSDRFPGNPAPEQPTSNSCRIPLGISRRRHHRL
jgi:hypothetical protein